MSVSEREAGEAYFAEAANGGIDMAAVLSAFAEYLFKFVIYLAVAALGVFAGIKLKQKNSKEK